MTEKLFQLIDVIAYREYVLVHLADRVLVDGWRHTEMHTQNFILSADDVKKSLENLQYDEEIFDRGMAALVDEDIHHFKMSFHDGILKKAVLVEVDDFFIEKSLI